MSDQPSNTNALQRLGQGVFNMPYLLLTLTVLFWAGNAVLGRAVHESMNPIGLAFWRWTMACLIVSSFAWRHVLADLPQYRKHWKETLILAILGIAAFNTLLYTALQTTTAVNGVLIQSSMPVLVVILSFFLFRERITTIQGVGVAVSLSGAVAIVARGDLQVLAELSFNQGDLWVVTAVIAYAFYSALLRLKPKVNPFGFLAVTFGLGAIILLPFYIGEVILVGQFPVTPVTLAAIGYVGLFPSIVSYLCFNRGVELVGANRATLFIHLIPVFGSVMAVVFLGERLYPYHFIGLALILSGIYLATRR